MKLDDGIDDTRTVIGNLRYVHEHATDSRSLAGGTELLVGGLD
jgi:hypothetical protein